MSRKYTYEVKSCFGGTTLNQSGKLTKAVNYRNQYAPTANVWRTERTTGVKILYSRGSDETRASSDLNVALAEATARGSQKHSAEPDVPREVLGRL